MSKIRIKTGNKGFNLAAVERCLLLCFRCYGGHWTISEGQRHFPREGRGRGAFPGAGRCFRRAVVRPQADSAEGREDAGAGRAVKNHLRRAELRRPRARDGQGIAEGAAHLVQGHDFAAAGWRED